MGYLFVLISVLSGTTKGYCGKKTSEFMKNPVDGVFISMIRMIICTLIGGYVGRSDLVLCGKLAYVRKKRILYDARYIFNAWRNNTNLSKRDNVRRKNTHKSGVRNNDSCGGCIFALRIQYKTQGENDR